MTSEKQKNEVNIWNGHERNEEVFSVCFLAGGRLLLNFQGTSRELTAFDKYLDTGATLPQDHFEFQLSTGGKKSKR